MPLKRSQLEQKLRNDPTDFKISFHAQHGYVLLHRGKNLELHVFYVYNWYLFANAYVE